MSLFCRFSYCQAENKELQDHEPITDVYVNDDKYIMHYRCSQIYLQHMQSRFHSNLN